MTACSLDEGFPADAVEQATLCKMDGGNGKEVLILKLVRPPLLTTRGLASPAAQRCGERQQNAVLHLRGDSGTRK